jgi:hypothetical protein
VSVKRFLENVENESVNLPPNKENLEKMKSNMQELVQTLEGGMNTYLINFGL